MDDPQYSKWITTATTIFLVWSLLLFAVRTWSKLRPGQQWVQYDNAIVAAMVVAFGQVITVYLSVSHGYGKPAKTVSPTDTDTLRKTLYSSQLLYVVSFGLSRCSASLFVYSLARSKTQKLLAVVVTGVTAAWIVASLFAIALRGDYTKPWMTLEGSRSLYIRWLGIEASGLVLEILVWFLCLSLIWGLNMKVGKRLSVLAVFGCRLILIPIVVIRLYYLRPQSAANLRRTTTLADILTEGAMQYSIMSCCITCLKPFLTPFTAGYGYSTGSGRYDIDTHRSGDPYTITNSSTNDPKPTKPLRAHARQSEVMNDPHKLRPDNGVFTTSVNGGPDIEPFRGDGDDIELLPSDNPAIQQTKTFTMTVERLA